MKVSMFLLGHPRYFVSFMGTCVVVGFGLMVFGLVKGPLLWWGIASIGVFAVATLLYVVSALPIILDVLRLNVHGMLKDYRRGR